MWSFVQFNVSIQGSDGIRMWSDTGHVRQALPIRHWFFIFIFFRAGTTIITMCLYWGVGFIYIMMDYFNWPKWIRKYKVQPGTNEPVDTKRLITVRPGSYLHVAHELHVAIWIPNKKTKQQTNFLLSQFFKKTLDIEMLSVFNIQPLSIINRRGPSLIDSSCCIYSNRFRCMT
jgi:hypothetical protein